MAETATTAAPAVKTSKNSTAQRLARAIKVSDTGMNDFRHARYEQMRQYGGTQYGSGGPEKAEPLNLPYSIVQTFLPALAIDPKSRIKSLTGEDFEPFGHKLSLAVNRVVEEIELGETFNTILIDSLFGMGIAYSGIVNGELGPDVDEQGYYHDAGETFVDHISPDLYIPDRFATKPEAYTFEAHKYLVGYEWAMDSGLFKKHLLEKLSPSLDPRRKRRLEALSKGQIDTSQHWIDQIELISAWLPDHNAIITLPGDAERTEDYLHEADWDGPEEGPYDKLVLMQMPDNALGISHVGIIYEMHMLINELARKIMRQTMTQKNLLLYDLADVRSAQAVQNATDNSLVGVKTAKNFQEARLGGADDSNYHAIDYFRQFLNQIGGNIDAIGGLTPQSETLGQDQMLYASASMKLNWWRGRALKCAGRIMKKAARHVWEDPLKQMNLLDERPYGVSVPLQWGPQERQGDFEDYAIDVEPYSIHDDTPERQYERVASWVKDVLLPLATLGQAQGVEVDVGVVAEVTGELGSIPRAREMVTTGMQQPEQAETNLNLANTTKTVNVGGQRQPGPQKTRPAPREVAGAAK
jgi:hypothetical protein